MNRQAQAASAKSTPSVLSIQALTAAIDAGHTKAALFSNPHRKSFSDLIAQMTADGYQLGTPTKYPQASRPGWTAWSVSVSSHTTTCDLLFYIPEVVS